MTTTNSTTAEAQVLARVSRDMRDERLGNARFVGFLRENFTRINVISSLDKNTDRADHFNFNVASKGNIGLSITTGSERLRVELYARGSNRLVADSGAPEGSELNENFIKLRAGNLEVRGGQQYVVKVSRGPGTPVGEKVDYVFQLTMGNFKYDYETLERPADNSVTRTTPTAALLGGILDTSTRNSSTGFLLNLIS